MLHGAARESKASHSRPSDQTEVESKTRPPRDAVDPVAAVHEARAAEDAFVDLLRDACTGPHFDASSGERLSRQIARCFDGGRVSLLAVDAADLDALPDAAWQLMDNRAFELGAAGIERLSLPLGASSPVAARLALLPHLTHLVITISGPQRNVDATQPVRVDLQGLASPKLMSVQVKPVAGLCVVVDPLVKCTATERFDMAVTPCWVEQPRPGSHATRVALAYEEPPDHGPPVIARVAPFAVGQPSEHEPSEQELHRCQIIRWLAKAGAYGPDAQAAAASASRSDGRSVALTAQNMASWQSTMAGKPDAVFDFRNLGLQLQECFTQQQPVAGKPPQDRWFLLDIGGCALGLGLQVRLEGGKPKHQILVCDPSDGKSRGVAFDPRKDVKLPGLLFAIANESALRAAMDESESPMAFMWEVPAKAAPAATSLKHVRPPEARASHLPFSDVRSAVAMACVVRTACEAGDAEFALREMRSISLATEGRDVFRQFQIGYHTALANHRGTEAKALLRACRPEMGPKSLALFLSGVKLNDGDGSIIYSGIQQAMHGGAQPDLVADHVASVFECSRHLEPGPLRALALGSADAREVPVIFELCESRADSTYEPDLPQRQQACVHAYLKAVLGHPAASTELGALVCESAAPEGRKAAVVALAGGNPGAAGAMVCAVLETCRGERLAVMVRALGVSAQQVLDALDASPAREDRAWAQRIRALPAALAATLAIEVPRASEATLRAHELLNPAEGACQVLRWLETGNREPADGQSEADRAITTRTRLNAALPACYLDLGQFGAALTSQFAKMDAGGASQRRFALEVGDRLIGIELRIHKGPAGGNNYTVSVRDPHNGEEPKIRRFQDLNALARTALDAWLPPALIVRYATESTGSDIGALLHWRSQDAPAAGTRPDEFVPNAALSGNFYRQLMMSGDVERATQLLKQMIARRGHAAVPLNSRLLDAIRTGFRDAMIKGHTGIASAYFEFVRALPREQFDASFKTALLTGVLGGPGDSTFHGGVQEALRNGQPKAAALFARFMIDKGLAWGIYEIIQVLEAFECVGDDGKPVGMPMLHAICSGLETPVATPRLRGRQHEAVHDFAAEFLKGDQFTLEQKDRLCNARISGVSAMRAGLENQNPCAAAAIACAILVHSKPHERFELMGRSGVTANEIQWALEDIADVDPEAQVWLARLLAAKGPELAETKEGPYASRATQVVMHVPQLDAAPAPGLVPGTLVGLADADQQVNELLRKSGLRVVRADSRGQVICATRQNLREEFQAAGLAFPLRGDRIPNDTDSHAGEELYRMAPHFLVRLGTIDAAPVAAASSGPAAARPNVLQAARRISRTPTAAWARGWVQGATAPGGAVAQSVEARGRGGLQYYVPGVGYPHLHVGGDFVRWSNGNGGGRYVIDHGGRVHLETIADLMRETVDPAARAVLHAIAGQG